MSKRFGYIPDFFPPTQRPTSGCRVGNNSAYSGFDAMGSIAGVRSLPFAAPAQFAGHSSWFDGTYWHETNWGGPVPFVMGYTSGDDPKPYYVIFDWDFKSPYIVKEVDLCGKVENVGKLSKDVEETSSGGYATYFGGFSFWGGVSGASGPIFVSNGDSEGSRTVTQKLKDIFTNTSVTTTSGSADGLNADVELTEDLTVVPGAYTATTESTSSGTQGEEIPWSVGSGEEGDGEGTASGDDLLNCGAFQQTKQLGAAYFLREFEIGASSESSSDSYVTYVDMGYNIVARMCALIDSSSSSTVGESSQSYSLCTPNGSIDLGENVTGLILAWSNDSVVDPDLMEDGVQWAKSDSKLDTFLIMYVPCNGSGSSITYGDLTLAHYRGDYGVLYKHALGTEEGVTSDSDGNFFIEQADPDNPKGTIKLKIFEASFGGSFSTTGKDIGICTPKRN